MIQRSDFENSKVYPVGLADEFMRDGERDEFFSRDHCRIADFTQQLSDHEDISGPLIGSNTSVSHNQSCTIRLIFPTRKIHTSGRLTRKQGKQVRMQKPF